MSWFNRGPCRQASALAAMVVLLTMTMGTAQALQGPLDYPAPERKQPASVLLLDVTRGGDRLVAVGEHGVIIYSDDKGRHWHQAEVPVSVTLTSVTFPTPQSGWAVGHFGVVLHSEDGGETWTKQLVGRKARKLEIAALKQALREAKAAGVPQKRISQLKRTIQRAEGALKRGRTRPLLGVWFSDSGTGVVVGAYGLAMRTSDGGRTWQPLKQAIKNPYGWHLNAVSRIGNYLFIAGEHGHVYRSADAGRTWRRIPTPYKGTYLGVTATADNGVLIYGLQGRVYRSPDYGKSWQQVKLPIELVITAATHMVDGSLVVAGAGGAVVCRSRPKADFQFIRRKGPPVIDIVPAGGSGVAVAVGISGVTRLKIGSEC